MTPEDALGFFNADFGSSMRSMVIIHGSLGGRRWNKGRIPCSYPKNIENAMDKSEANVHEFSPVRRLTNDVEKDCLTTE